MDLNSEHELINTRRKLRLLEQSYEEACADKTEKTYVREVTMESLRRLINQLKEEIARYEAGAVKTVRLLQTEQEAENTRRKLRMLEERYEKVRGPADGEGAARRSEIVSLKRLINQLKEDLARYECRQPARR